MLNILNSIQFKQKDLFVAVGEFKFTSPSTQAMEHGYSSLSPLIKQWLSLSAITWNATPISESNLDA